MEIYSQLAQKIIQEQQLIIGPLALIEARKVVGISIEGDTIVTIATDDKIRVIDSLVAQYERLFGKVSHEVCRRAVKSIIVGMPLSDIPASLQ